MERCCGMVTADGEPVAVKLKSHHLVAAVYTVYCGGVVSFALALVCFAGLVGAHDAVEG